MGDAESVRRMCNSKVAVISHLRLFGFRACVLRLVR